MSNPNVELLKRYYADPRGFRAYTDHIAPDAEFDFSAAFLDRPVFRGTTELERFTDESPFQGMSFTPESFLEVGEDTILVLVTATATGKGSGIPVEGRVAHEFTFRDGLLTRFRTHPDQQMALRELGLADETASDV